MRQVADLDNELRRTQEQAVEDRALTMSTTRTFFQFRLSSQLTTEEQPGTSESTTITPVT